jgi:CheY-like chemotaxis protein
MPRSPLLSNITIVIVEDHSDIRYLIGEFLGSHGAKVITAGDAFVGLRAIKENHPNIVLSDIHLPDRDGFELLRDIHGLSREDGGNVPVIAMTAFRDSSGRDLTIAAGFQEHLDKPFGPTRLLEAIDSVLNQ